MNIYIKFNALFIYIILQNKMNKISIFIFLYILSQFKIKNKNFTNIERLSEVPIINFDQNIFINNTDFTSFEQQNFKNYKGNKANYSIKIKSTSFNNKNNNQSDINKISDTKKNLLIGTVINYGWEKMALFFKSFQKAQFKNCDLVIFIHNISPFSISKLKSYGVIIYKIPDICKNIRIINCRWKIYADFLNDNPNKYNLVFTADVRDVIFQQDIFKFYDSEKPFLGIAFEDNTLLNEVNKKWIIEVYGEKLYKTIENERIICLGTIWGTPDKFKEFSYLMWESLNSGQVLINKVTDQAIGNFLIYHDKLFNNSIKISENTNGPVMTIGFTKRENIKLDRNNNILNEELKVAAVVHQYDRKKDLLKILMNKYCPEIKRGRYYYIIIDRFSKYLHYHLNRFILIIVLIIFFSISSFLFFLQFINKRRRKKIHFKIFETMSIEESSH